MPCTGPSEGTWPVLWGIDLHRCWCSSSTTLSLIFSLKWRRCRVGNSNACLGRSDDMEPWTGTRKIGGNGVILPVQREFEHQPLAGNSIPRGTFLSESQHEEGRAAAREPTLGFALEAVRFDSPAIAAIHKMSPADRPMASAQIRPAGRWRQRRFGRMSQGHGSRSGRTCREHWSCAGRASCARAWRRLCQHDRLRFAGSHCRCRSMVQPIWRPSFIHSMRLGLNALDSVARQPLIVLLPSGGWRYSLPPGWRASSASGSIFSSALVGQQKP